MTPTQLSLALLRERGYHCEVVEKWNPHAFIRQDLWGFIDILAIKRDEVLAVQTTTGDAMASRVKKITDHENVGVVREAGIAIHVHGWKEVSDGKTKAGKPKKKWACREVDLS